LATLFRENGIDYEKVNYFNEPFTEQKLRDLAQKAGIRPIKMMRGAAAAGFTEATPDEEVISAMTADPNLIQRPIVEVGENAVVARPVGKALALIK
jgi:arsenate reductase (glutaredoxin)